LWYVPDAATRILMEEFNARLLAGVGRAEALWAAQSRVRQTNPNPYFWAPLSVSATRGR
jgi:CHAT domain-containing protein